MNKQIVIINGGDTFETYEIFLECLKNSPFYIDRCISNKRDWKPWLRTVLPEEYQVIIPSMPNSANAQYIEWKIVFEKMIPFLGDGVVLVGHSLGGSFLAKYLSETVFLKKIQGVFLVAPAYDTDTLGYGLASFALPKKMNLQTKNIFLYQSKDDPVVPFSAMENFTKEFPKATARIFENRKHINTEDFPELLADILSLFPASPKKHKVSLPGYDETQKKLAQDIHRMRYDAVEKFYDETISELCRQSAGDQRRGYKKLSAHLHTAMALADELRKEFKKIYALCKPHMEKE